MENDWLFKTESNICSFRTVGVLLRDNKILVQREKDGTEYALPGGHVKIGETTEQSIIREYKEETGADISCDRLLWVEETFWNWDGRETHSIAFYYFISLKKDSDIPDDCFQSHKDNCHVVLKWVTIDEMKRLTIYPNFLKDKIEKNTYTNATLIIANNNTTSSISII